MMRLLTISLFLTTFIGPGVEVLAYSIHFQNSCSYTIWPAVGKAPNGQPDGSVRFGQRLNPGESTDFKVANNQLGIRAWGRTGCNE